MDERRAVKVLFMCHFDLRLGVAFTIAFLQSTAHAFVALSGSTGSNLALTVVSISNAARATLGTSDLSSSPPAWCHC